MFRFGREVNPLVDDGVELAVRAHSDELFDVALSNYFQQKVPFFSVGLQRHISDKAD